MPHHEPSPDPEPATFESAERLERLISPPDYYPLIAVNDYMVYDDELEDLEPGPWRVFFNGGGNGLYFVRADNDGGLYFVSSLFTGYEYATPEDGGRYDSAYDAFYAADQLYDAATA